jgi:drug/metabolite transporter (DMT)-like permease
VLAFAVLLPFAIHRGHIGSLIRLSRSQWIRLAILGLVFYAVTQGAMYWALSYLPAVTLSLVLNFSPIVVAVLGIAFLGEKPGSLQWVGIGVFLVGTVLYFYPVSPLAAQPVGFLIAGVCVLSNALSSILGRHVNRSRLLSPTAVTLASMGIGSIALLIAGIIIQGFPPLSLLNWVIILWLAVINSAFAFTLWNRTLSTLSATESSIINNTMLIQIAVLAWIFLGERLNWQEMLGLGLAAVGVLAVQIRRSS